MRLIFSIIVLFCCITNSYAKQNVFKDVITINVGKCELEVYTAITDNQKITGMLVFDDSTFDKDGMLFVGNKMRVHHYHTVGMRMDIVIMGVQKVGNNTYKVNGDVKFSPPGLDRVDIVGDSVLEIPTKLYNSTYKNCLTK